MKRYLWLLVFLAGCEARSGADQFVWYVANKEVWECYSEGIDINGHLVLRNPAGMRLYVTPGAVALTREGAGGPELLTVPYPRPAAEAE